MGSSAIAGYKSFIQVSSDSGVTYADVAEQRSCTLDQSHDTADVTNKTTSPGASGMLVKERVVTATDWRATVECNYTGDATTQAAMITAANAGTALTFRFVRQKTAGQPTAVGSGVITYSINYPLDQAATIRFAIEAASGTILTAGTYS